MREDVRSDPLPPTETPPGRHEVAAYACDPGHATTWYENITAVEWQTPPPLGVGSRIAFAARFLGRRLSYTYEVLASCRASAS